MMDNYRPGQQNGMFHSLMRSAQDGGMNNSDSSPFGGSPQRDLGSVTRGGVMGGRIGGLVDSMKGGGGGGGGEAGKYAKSLLKGAMERFTPENAPNKMTPMPGRLKPSPDRMGSSIRPRMGALNRQNLV